MATTKQYSDLQDGGSLQSNDKFAVARDGEKELVTVSADAVAQRAADIVQDGACAELMAAVSLGKRELAKRLCDKGADVKETDTLVDMADALGNLAISGSFDFKKGFVPYGYDYEASFFAAAANPVMLLRNFKDTILYSHGILRYIPYGDYETLDEFLAAATCSIAIDTQRGIFSCMALSGNGQYLALPIANNKINLYSVNKELGTLELKKEISLTITSKYQTPSSADGVLRYGCIPAVSDDGELVSYFTSNSLSMALVNTNTGETVEKKLSFSGFPVSAMFVDKKIYFTTVSGVYEVPFEKEPLALGSSASIMTSGVGVRICCPALGKLLGFGYETIYEVAGETADSVANSPYYNTPLLVYNPENPQKELVRLDIFNTCNLKTGAKQTSNGIMGVYFPCVKKEGNLTTFYIPKIGEFVLDLEKNCFLNIDPRLITFGVNFSGSIKNSLFLFESSSSNTIGWLSSSAFMNTISGYGDIDYILPGLAIGRSQNNIKGGSVQYYERLCNVGLVRAMQNKTVLYGIGYVSHKDLQTGAYDYQSQTVELEAEQ